MIDDSVLTIRIPNGSNWPATVQFPIRLAELERTPEIRFDFRDITFVSPGWMIIVVRAMRDFREARPGSLCRVVHTNAPAMRYAGHAGFFDALGIPWNKAMGEAPTSSTFIPLTERSVASLFECQPLWRQAGDIIQEDAEKLASVLAQSQESVLFHTLAYAIREIIRNVVEHSDSVSFRIAAQCWSASGTAEIAIGDAGIGIAAALASNGKYAPLDDASALTLATQPGVTGTIISSRSDDAWANSGYGLFMAKALAHGRQGFTLISGEAALLAGEKGECVLRSRLGGTGVVLRLKAGDDKLEARLSSIAARAGGTPSRASTSARVTPRNC